MSDGLNMTVSEETLEVAEPTVETSAEEQEVAEPVSEENTEGEEELDEVEAESKGKDDSAWAQMRRDNAKMQAELDATNRELAELKAQAEARNSILGSDSSEDWELEAIAEQTGKSLDEVRALYELEKTKAENEALRKERDAKEIDAIMEQDLREVQKIDPSIKSLDDIGEEFGSYISAGLTAKQAYYAIQGEKLANKAKPPSVTAGAVKSGGAEREYFNDAEIEAMSPEQRTKNYKKIIASWGR